MKIFKDEWQISENEYKCPLCSRISWCKLGIVKHYQSCAGLVSKTRTKTGKSWNRGLTKETDPRVKKISDTFYKNMASGKTIRKGHPHSEETKRHMSIIRRKYLQEHPEDCYYKKNHSSKGPSYAESYFKEIFVKENIPLEYHLRIGSYELDFYNKEKGIDVEIDGHQHTAYKEIVESDKRRTEYLESLGWKVIRINWAIYQTKIFEEKLKIIQEIKEIVENSKPIDNLELLLRDNKEFRREKKIKEIEENEKRKLQLIDERKNIIINCGVNFQKYGWIEDIKNILGVSHTHVKRFMKKYMIDFYNQCYQRNKI